MCIASVLYICALSLLSHLYIERLQIHYYYILLKAIEGGDRAVNTLCASEYLSVVPLLLSMLGEANEWGRWTAAVKWIGEGSN